MQFDYRLNAELLSTTLAVCGDSSEEMSTPSHLISSVGVTRFNFPQPASPSSTLWFMVSYISQRAFREITSKELHDISIFEKILQICIYYLK